MKTNDTRAARGPRRKGLRRLFFFLVVVVVLLVGARIALPYAAKAVINRELARNETLGGHVDGVDFALLQGQMRIHGVEIKRRMGEVEQPFAGAKTVETNFRWTDLLAGKFTGTVELFDPTLFLSNENAPSQAEVKEAAEEAKDWREALRQVFPIELREFRVHNGWLQVRDATQPPPVDLFIRNIELAVDNLTNRPQEGRPRPTSLRMTGETIGNGQVKVEASLNLLAELPELETKASIEGLNLVALNEAMRSYANVDVARGTFQNFMELKAADGRFEGYVKPLIEDVQFSSVDDKGDPLLSRVWEKVVAGVAHLIKNQPRDQIASVIPVEGRVDQPSPDAWGALVTLLRNGFVEALTANFEGARSLLPRGKEPVDLSKPREERGREAPAGEER